MEAFTAAHYNGKKYWENDDKIFDEVQLEKSIVFTGANSGKETNYEKTFYDKLHKIFD